MGKSNFKKILMIVVPVLLVIFIILLTYKTYKFEQRLLTAEGKLEDLLKLIPSPGIVNGKDISGNKVLFERTDNCTNVYIDINGSKTNIVKVFEGNDSIPDRVEISGITFVKYGNGIVIRDSSGSDIVLNELNLRTVEAMNKIEMIQGFMDEIKRFMGNNDSVVLEMNEKIDSILSNYVRREDLHKNSVDIENVARGVVDLGAKLEKYVKEFDAQDAENFKTINQKIDENTSKQEAKDKEMLTSLTSVTEKVTKSSKNLHCTISVSPTGDIKVLNTNTNGIDLGCTKEKNRSIYAVFFDSRYVSGIPIVSITPVTNSINTVIVNIVKICDKYCQYRLFSIVSGKETDCETIVTIQCIQPN
jgi:hypothetical protein